MISKRTLFTSSLLLLSLCASAQIAIVGLPHDDTKNKSASNAAMRTMALELPFWDDFATTKTSYANKALWTFGESIRVNDGMGIRPPSKRVATFDGLDSLGKPYNVNDVLAKGYADKLESKGINLKSVPAAQRNTVFLSYYYQLKGRGEIPDAGDRLLLSFRDSLKHWIPVDTIENNGAMDTDIFYASIMQITDPKWFHSDFAFRIQNFSRLSGPYDTWNVDYIYLNKGRTAADLSFPDRTISEPMTKLFGNYTIVPKDHFLRDTTIKTRPAPLATNMRSDLEQNVDYFSRAFITAYKNKVATALPRIRLDSVNNEGQAGFVLRKNQYSSIPFDSLPSLSKLVAANDSLTVDLNFILYAKDNLPIADAGDYDAAKYAPIDFRANDSTTSRFEINSKYAYDDGVAEYGAGLNQPAAQLAYQYDIIGPTANRKGYVTQLEFYFPRFGDESQQLIDIRIWTKLADNDGKLAKPVYTASAALVRGQNNVYWRYKLTRPIPVDGTFYVGWQQSTSATIAVGLDKSSDTGPKMFYNTNGVWVQNTLVQGNLMIRPVFGEGVPVDPLGLEGEKTLTVYPNPSNGVFQFAGSAEHIVVYDMNGRNVSFVSERSFDETTTLTIHGTNGIYIIKAFQDGVMRTAKVLIRQ